MKPSPDNPAAGIRHSDSDREVAALAETLVPREPPAPDRPEQLDPAILPSLSPAECGAGAGREETHYSLDAAPETSAVPPATRSLARSVADYDLISELGRGGMGVVYKAIHRKLKRTVALKMILAGVHASGEEVTRFRLEAEAVARLKHPGIVQIYEIGEEDGNPFFALEFVDGGSLDRFRGKSQPGRLAAGVVAGLARAMHAAHQAGVVHRDLKPANVLLSRRADVEPVAGQQPDLSAFEPKITDFGLAKQLDAADGLSRSGAIMGTPAYMAPEQAEGRIREIGPATDVYSLCAILYDLLTGRPPFVGTTVWETLDQVRTQEPVSPKRLQPSIPLDLETICLKGLRKDARQRYPSAAALADDLTRFLDGRPILARPVSAWERVWKWARREPIRAAAVAAVCLALVGLVVGAVFFGLYKEQQATALSQKIEQQQKLRQRLEDLRRSAEEAETSGQLAVARQHLDEAVTLLTNDQNAAAEEMRSRFEEGQGRVKRKQDEQAAALSQKMQQQEEQAKLQAARKDFGERVERFGRHRDEVLFHAVSFRDEYAADGAALVRGAAPAALKELGLDATKRPKEFATGLELFRAAAEPAAQLKTVAVECYQTLLSWAAAVAAPGGGMVDTRADPRLALRLLDAAASLAAAHHLEPPQLYHLRRASCHEMLGEISLARQERDRAEAITPNTTIDLFESALEHYRKGQIDQAEAACQRIAQQEPNHFWTQYVGALCNLRRQQWSVAIARLNACVDRRRDSAWLLMYRALAHAGAGDLPSAEADFKQALDRAGDPALRAVVLINRSSVWFKRKRWPDAEADLLQAIALQPRAYQGHANLATVYQSQRKYDKAIEAMDEAIKRQPAIAGLYSARAHLHLNRGEAAAARRDFEAFMTREPEGSASAQWAEALVELARMKLKAGELDGALADCDAILAVKPDFAPAHAQRAETLLRLARYADAAQSIDRYLSTGGKGTGEIHRVRGMIHTHFGKHAEAVAAYSRALEQKQDAETYSLRGWSYLAQEALKPALTDFDAALALEPKHPEALAGSGMTRMMMGQAEKALIDIEAALKVGPKTPHLLFQSACIYARAAAQPGTEREKYRHQERTLDLLRMAFAELPEAERAKFWAEHVEKSAALASLRRSGAMLSLARSYRRN